MSIELWRTRPYTSMLQNAVDQMYRKTFPPFTDGNLSDGGSTGFQSLPVNVWETDDAYVAKLLAPGLDDQTINVTVHEDTLAIEGALMVQIPDGARPVWEEFGPSRFRRSLRLGASVDSARVEATYRDGVLMVTMPKAEHARPRQIQVQVQLPSSAAQQPLSD